jgi:hypothetical protein
MAVSSYGASVVLQNNSGSAAASGAPTGSVFLFASGAVGSAKLFMNKEGSASDLELGSLKVEGDTGSETISAGETLTIAGGTGLDTALSSGTITFSMDLNELSAATVDVSADSIAIIDANDSNGSKKEAIADVVTAVAGNGLAASAGVLALDLNELSAASVNVGNDSIAIIDADDSNGSKKESIADLATAMAGVGIAASSGQFVLDISEISDVQVASGDKFLMLDSDDSTEQLESVDDLATFMAGDGLAASSGVLAVQVGTNKGLALTSDKLEITGSAVADGTLAVGTDTFMFFDSDGSVKEESIADLSTAQAGAGLAATSGVLAVVNATNGGLNVNANDVNLDLNDLAAAAVAVGADSIAIIDADDNGSKKESIADLATAMAGDGLAASSGVFAVQVGTNKGLALTSDKLEITGSAVAAEAVAVGTDSFMFFDSDGSVKEESFADYATALAGDGLAASSGVLAVGVDDTGIEINSDALRLKDNGVTLAKMAGITRGSVIIGDSSGDPSLLAKGTSGQFLQSDGTDPSYVTMSGDVASLASGGAVTLAAAQTNITSLLATDIKIGEDDQTKIDFETADQIHFYANNAQRVAITANGLGVGAGAGAGGSSLGVDGTGNFDGGIVAGSSNQGDSTGGFRVYGSATGEEMIWSVASNNLSFKYHDGSSQATIMTLGGDESSDFAIEVANGSNNNNKIKAAAFVTYSDESLKSDVSTMNTALDTVMSLNGVEFTWKDSGERDFGFIAQDVEKVLPKAVHSGNDGISGVDYSRLTSVLVEAVKAQQVQIEDLKKVITNLKK